jgi:hypothetical protein
MLMKTIGNTVFACGALMAMLGASWPLVTKSRDPLTIAVQLCHQAAGRDSAEHAHDQARLKLALKGVVLNREVSKYIVWTGVVMMSAGFAGVSMLSRNGGRDGHVRWFSR